MNQHQELAQAIAAALEELTGSNRLGLARAIEVEILIVALEHPRAPTTVSELRAVLAPLSFGDVPETLLAAVEEWARREPGLRLLQLAERAA